MYINLPAQVDNLALKIPHCPNIPSMYQMNLGFGKQLEFWNPCLRVDHPSERYELFPYLMNKLKSAHRVKKTGCKLLRFVSALFEARILWFRRKH